MSLYPGINESQLNVNGVTVNVYDNQLETTRTPIVLVHGTGSTAQANFWALYPMLAFEHRVVALDLALPSDGSPMTLDVYTRQLEAVIESINAPEGVALVGYSLGAVVALALTAERPDLVKQLVTIAGWMKTDRHQLHRNDLYRRLVEEAPELVQDFVQFASYSAPYVSSRTQPDYEELVARVQGGKPYPQELVTLNRTIDIVDQVHSIQVPALVIGCLHDQMVQVRHSKELFGALNDSRYAEIQAGHAVVHERPAQLFALIDRFVLEPQEHPAGTVLPQAIV